jgi:tetratricopeptide (TPR) repeat protein
VSPRRARALVGLAAAAAAGVVVGVAVLQAGEEAAPAVESEPELPAPPLELGLLLRSDDEAEALREAERLVDEGEREEARARFEELLAENPASVEAAVGAAVASWPNGTVEQLEELAAGQPESGLVRLHLGLALLAGGDEEGARRAWLEVERVDPDTPAALRAEDLLNPQFAPGRPPFVAPLEAPPGLEELSPEEQLAELERRADEGGVEERLAYGIALQRVGRPVSAREAFSAAAEADPASLPAKVAAAVGRFDKDDPSQAFSRLGPLGERFPDAAVVRFHLGLMLLWLRDVEGSRAQLEQAVELEPGSIYARQASLLLDRLEEAGAETATTGP